MATYKTPGVFIEEIPTLGSSVAGVPTAVTGFAGYTEKAILLDGTSALMLPVRITSLMEYQQIFGGPFNEQFTVTLTGTVPTPTTIAVAPTTTLSNYILFYQVQMFYANGGGTCYIVSVGNYPAPISVTDLKTGVDKFEQIDEITLLVTPESVFLSPTDRNTVNTEMVSQCAKLQDRFAVLDVVHIGTNTIFQDATGFRNNDIGANNLKYVAAYYPALNTPTIYFYNDTEVVIDDNRSGAPLYNGINNNSLYTIFNGISSFGTFSILSNALTIADGVTINGTTLLATQDFAVGGTIQDTANNLKNAINSNTALSSIVVASIDITSSVLVQSKIMGTAGNYSAVVVGTHITYVPSLVGINNSADKTLYNNITTELAKYTLTLYPSASMTGIYAQVDATRGVWKAPANVGLALVNQPSIMITDDDQQDLNVDSVSGKSINAIRFFTGRGTLIWGARTLAGNDNEWRYINVRRLFTYVEESLSKATEFVVFEPNTANTWQRVKGMAEAFLTGLWSDGGLAGATPKDAFFVSVGLGTTMTAQDILEGRMIVVIGMAAVRPAEFIILQFEHKLQVS
jgi:phage tail sheath protein FI